MNTISCPLCPYRITGVDPAWIDEYKSQMEMHLNAAHTVTEVISHYTDRPTTQRRACHKIGYPDERTATVWLLRTWRKSNDPRRQERRAYQCDRCAYWHLTSKPVREKAATT